MCVLGLVLGVMVSNAQTGEKSAQYKAAEDLMLAMNMPQNTNNGISDMAEAQAAGNPMLASKKDALKKFMLKHMSWEVMGAEYTKMYADEFSEAELKDMASFYRTDVGKKMAAKQNTITMKASQLGQDKMQAHMSELMQLMQ